MLKISEGLRSILQTAKGHRLMKATADNSQHVTGNGAEKQPKLCLLYEACNQLWSLLPSWRVTEARGAGTHSPGVKWI